MNPNFFRIAETLNPKCTGCGRYYADPELDNFLQVVAVIKNLNISTLRQEIEAQNLEPKPAALTPDPKIAQVVAVTVTLEMTAAEFDLVKDDFVATLAESLGILPSAVHPLTFNPRYIT